MTRVRTSSHLRAAALVAAVSTALCSALVTLQPGPAAATRPDGTHREAGHLLPAEQLPAVDDRAWTVEAEGSESGSTVGVCQKSALEQLGAVHAVRRTYVADDGFTAAAVVGEFADGRSAWRIHQVLEAWREDCESRVSDADVGRLRTVAVPTGTGTAYRGAFAAGERTAGLAILRAGRHLVLVEISAPSERYPAGWDPARVAVRRVARTF